MAVTPTGVFVTGSSIFTDSPQPDVYTIKYTFAGAVAWQARYDIAQTSAEIPSAIVVQGNDTYVAAQRDGTGTPSDAIVVLKYGSTGVLSNTWSAEGANGVGVRTINEGISPVFYGARLALDLTPLTPAIYCAANFYSEVGMEKFALANGARRFKEGFRTPGSFGVDRMSAVTIDANGDAMLVGELPPSSGTNSDYWALRLFRNAQD